MARPNILFIPIDDLRPQLGCYDQPQMKTPHLDQLASEGTLYRQAYCQVPVCGASRCSLLTGRRPTRSRFLDYLACVDEDLPGAVTLPQHFRQNGYQTVSVGKVFHHRTDSAERSWCNEPWHPRSQGRGGAWRNYQTAEAQQQAQAHNNRGPAYECADVADNAYFDGQIADQAAAEMRRLRDLGEPFFLAAGFIRPHLPFNAPKRYWDLYNHDDVPLADNPFAPQDAPARAVHNFGELRSYFNVPKEGPLPDDFARWLVHGYYAATSFMDAQVGRLLRSLDELGLTDNTIVCAWGDHGWQLGEHGMWCKHCNFETSLNAPLIFRVPEQRGGVVTDAVCEFVDIFPTLADLADLDLPPDLAGVSLAPTLDDPAARVKDAAYSRWHAGESVRTDDYLYTEWLGEDGNREHCMMYDHAVDRAENVNVAVCNEHTERLQRYSEMLRTVRESTV